MTGREAFQCLFLDFPAPHGVDPERDVRRVVANAYARAVKPRFEEGIPLFASVYDLILWHDVVTRRVPRDGTDAYRGQSRHTWRLVPTLYRDLDSLQLNLRRTKEAARFLLEHGPAVVRELDPGQLLGVLQHYGFPTFLLDFSSSIQVACAFACLSDDRLSEPLGYGAILMLSDADHRELVPEADTPLGHRFLVRVDPVRRIARQRALFLSRFKTPFAEDLIGFARYYFCHGPDDRYFLDDMGFTREYLFPTDDLLARLLDQSTRTERRTTSRLAADLDMKWSSICRLLDEGAISWQKPVEWTDWLEIVRGWFDLGALPAERFFEVEVACRWYAKVQESCAPLLSRSLRTIQMLVEDIMIDPLTRIEDVAEAWNRIRRWGSAVSGADSELLLRRVLREARQEAESDRLGAQRLESACRSSA